MQVETSSLSIQQQRSQETYSEGVSKLQEGDIEGAIVSFLECSFFSPDNANPEAALAECYIFLCDLQSAVRHYRRALWMLTRRRREAAREVERKRGASLLLFNSPPVPHFLGDGEIPSIDGPDGEDSPSSISIPKGKEKGAVLSPEEQRQMTKDFSNDSGVEKKAVISRLVGLLDALGIVLFRLSDYEQALRCTLEINDMLEDADLPTVPVVELHRATYLMALQKEEEAEFLLESMYQSPIYDGLKEDIGSLLVQLYSGRQAFLKARELLTALERPEDHEYTKKMRFHPSLTISKHIFLKKYNYYRAKALEQRDLGTINKCIMVTPEDLELVFARAKIYIDSGNEKKSVKDLFQCIKDSNGSHKEAIELMTTVLFSIGSSMEGQTGIEEAVSYYSESLKWRGDNIPVILARGDCYVKLEDYENALKDFERVLELEPGNPEATNRLSFLHDLWGCKMMKMGDMQGAEEEFTNAIKTNDGEALFYYHRAQARFALDEPRFALRDVLSCQELNPTDPKIRAFIVRYLGSEEVPDTSKSAVQPKQIPGGVPTLQVKKDGGYSARRAADLYGRPSARINKELAYRPSPASAPVTARHETLYGPPNKKAVANSLAPLPQRATYRDFALDRSNNTESDGLSLLSGTKAALHQGSSSGGKKK